MSDSFSPITVYRQRMPFFSVICCTYNRASLLPRAIDSLLAQTEPDWELIVVDDGSNDATTEIVRSYAEKHNTIRYLFHQNRGLGASRNAGILAACGFYICFLDSDDEYLPEHLAIRKTICLENPEIPFFHGGLEVIGDPTVPDRNDISKRVHLNDCAVGGTFVIRRELAIALGGFPSVRYADDALFYNKIVEAEIPVGRVGEPTYRYYRDTPDSLCNTIGLQ